MLEQEAKPYPDHKDLQRPSGFTADYVALDEQYGLHKQASRCTRPEIERLIAMRERKIKEVQASLLRFESLLRCTPEWAEQPNTTFWSRCGIECGRNAEPQEEPKRATSTTRRPSHRTWT